MLNRIFIKLDRGMNIAVVLHTELGWALANDFQRTSKLREGGYGYEDIEQSDWQDYSLPRRINIHKGRVKEWLKSMGIEVNENEFINEFFSFNNAANDDGGGGNSYKSA